MGETVEHDDAEVVRDDDVVTLGDAERDCVTEVDTVPLPLPDADGDGVSDDVSDTDCVTDGECVTLTVTDAVRDATTVIDGVAERDVVTVTETDPLAHDVADGEPLADDAPVDERVIVGQAVAECDGDVDGDIVVVSDAVGERDCVGETELDPLPLPDAVAAGVADEMPVSERV